jgi:hypothetical protein
VTPPVGDAVVARWSDADTSLTLVRGTYPTTLRLIIARKSTEALAQNATAEARDSTGPKRRNGKRNASTEWRKTAARRRKRPGS